MNVEFATETEITAVAISKDNNFITNASYNKSDNTVTLWNHSIYSDTFHDKGSIKINLEEKAPLNDKIDLTISKLIPSSNSRFVILSYLFKENDSRKVKAMFIVLQWENDNTVVNINSENDPVVDKAKTVLDEPMDDAKIVFKVFKNGKKSEADILRKVKNKIEVEFSKIEDGFINAEFLADGVILAIKYKTTIQFASIASEPWTLFNIKSYLRNQHNQEIVDMVRINVNSYEKCIIEFNRISCISNISKIQSIVGKKVVMSSTGDLLAFENGPIVEKQTGLHIANIAEEHVSSNKKDFLFMNDDRHLFIVYSDETSLKAILIDACSGTELKSVKTPPEPELANLKHIQLINDDVITVTSNKNNAVIKKRHWKEFFRNQPKKIQLEEWQLEKWQVKGILLPRNFDFDNFDFDNFVLKERSDINIDDDADCFFLFWKDRKNNSETRCLVWMLSEIENSGNNPTVKIKFDVDVDGTLRLYDENKAEEFYTFLPLSSTINDKNLPAEWVQSSCNYLKKRNLNNSLKEIIINSIRQYVDNNVFNGTTAICDLIDSDASDVDNIIMAILGYKKYMPTGLYKKNPLTKAIEKENIVLVGKILEYCLHVHYFRNYEPGFMSVVVDALPSLTDKYPEMLLKLLEQCTYLKVPSDWEIGFQGVYSTKNHKSRELNRLTEQPATKKLFTTLIELAAFILPVTTGCLELSNKTASPELRSLSILSLWIMIFLQLRFIEKIGMFAAVFTNLFEQIMPLLIFLFFILFAYANSLMVLLSETSPDNGVNTFTGFYQSIKNTWLILLNDYSSLEPWTKNYLLDILMITFSLSTAIILFNVLIALVSNAYEETLKNAHTIWVIELAEIIAEIELNPLISHYFPTLRAEVPWTIIYRASTEDVEK
ncbi:11153_t:CDS:2 [Rhizophagus irregularis]|nr:11153_t:CDS:2 [Rhizophagus irregularis]